ncbi:MAG: fructose-specific PTS transporter subunit EIIC [Hespellia sp.]|nr:fructose-specific PTS transporter subunit EIIC [Hespellia sp.]
MKISDLLKKSGIELNGQVSTKAETIDKMVDLMVSTGNISNKEKYKACVLAREEEGTTGIGEGIAIPHGKTDAVKAPGLAAMVVPGGVDYESLDGAPTDLIFLIAAPNTEDNVHLEVLSRLSTMLMDETFTTALRNAGSVDEFLQIVNEAEKAQFAAEDAKAAELASNKGGFQVIGVTACPTGIAHTYMAAESLENKAKEMGYTVKIETDGSGGVKNELTKEDISNADVIIVAADKNIEMARFDGKPVIQTKVADGIHKAEELITKGMNGEAPIYHHTGGSGSDSSDSGSGEGVGRSVYKHLMNGVSHMLPFVIGGGILIAIAFLLDDYAIDPSNFGMNTPIAAFFKTVGGEAFGFMLPVLSGFIAMSIADRPGLAVGFVGGAIANAGYTFASVMNGNEGAISSGFLGALLAGFVAGYLILLLRKICDKLPKSLEGIKPILIYPVVGILAIGFIMILVNPFVGALNNALNNGLNSMGGSSKILLGAVLGGMMSIDMGGPFNKAAYVFGTASLASGGFDIMAAVMAGGMVPPLAIAICATIFKNRFNKKDRQSAYVNYIMGLSFISEGAIPFAAQDPLRVIPSCIVGSAIAGALSMAFDCGLRAPHGGVFVIPLVTNPLMYVVAIVVGSVVGALILSVLKKPVKEA